MGDKSQRHPGVEENFQAICIKQFLNPGVGFNVRPLEIVRVTNNLESKYFTVAVPWNHYIKRTFWWFSKDRKTSPMEYFNDYFRVIE